MNNNIIEEILNKMKLIKYGWIDKFGVIHHHAKKQFFLDNYHFMSIDDTLKYKVGTCFEQAELIRYYLNENNIDAKTYMILYDDEEKIAKHTICVALIDNKYYLMESSWFINDNNIEFTNLEDILIKIFKLYPKMYKLEPMKKELISVYEYRMPEVNLTYQEFCEFVKSEKRIELDLSNL